MKSLCSVVYQILGPMCLVLALSSCSPTAHQATHRDTPVGVVVTSPAYYNSHYSTQKARYISERYSENLAHLQKHIVDKIAWRPQFANDVVAVSMGVFTHTASQPPDQRYVEIILDMPDVLPHDMDLRVKVERLFSQYGKVL